MFTGNCMGLFIYVNCQFVINGSFKETNYNDKVQEKIETKRYIKMYYHLLKLKYCKLAVHCSEWDLQAGISILRLALSQYYSNEPNARVLNLSQRQLGANSLTH